MTNQGVNHNLVVVTPSKEKNIAYCVGLCLNNVSAPLFNLIGKVAAGFILINEKNVNKFKLTDDEVQFILAHECSHVLQNHVATTGMWSILERTLRGDSDANAELVNMIKVAFVIFSAARLPPNAVAIRSQEFQADEMAVRITGNRDTAISCLAKLAGGDMDGPSYTWELFGTDMPVMTMGQRIEELRTRSTSYFRR